VEENKKNSEIIKKIVVAIMLIIVLYCAYYLTRPLWITYKNNSMNKDISNKYHQSINKSKNFKDRYSALLQVNSDLVGWITIPGTKLDYPVVRVENNDFYLDHNFEKQPSDHGAVFMDFRNKGDLQTKNNIIYGHNMKDGSMFQELMNYKDEKYFKENPIIQFDTLKEPVKWQIFSVYVTNTKFNYIRTDFKDDADYENFLSQIKSHSMYNTGVNVSKDDSILTLSTCSYEIADGRLAIEAKRIK
jgi:sortase B